jgi:hypothetical protein
MNWVCQSVVLVPSSTGNQKAGRQEFARRNASNGKAKHEDGCNGNGVGKDVAGTQRKATHFLDSISLPYSNGQTQIEGFF